MNPLIKLNRQLHYLFVALLLACFAIAQSAMAIIPEPDGGDANGSTAEEENAVLDLSTDAESGAMGQSTPKLIGHNKWVIPIDFTKPLQCAGGDVMVHADVVVTFKNVPLGVMVESLKLEGFRGTATSGARKLEAKNLKRLLFFDVKQENGQGKGKFGIEFEVTGPGLPVASPLRFMFKLGPILYEFRDGKVTKIVPDDTPIVKCSRR